MPSGAPRNKRKKKTIIKIKMEMEMEIKSADCKLCSIIHHFLRQIADSSSEIKANDAGHQWLVLSVVTGAAKVSSHSSA